MEREATCIVNIVKTESTKFSRECEQGHTVTTSVNYYKPKAVMQIMHFQMQITVAWENQVLLYIYYLRVLHIGQAKSKSPINPQFQFTLSKHQVVSFE